MKNMSTPLPPVSPVVLVKHSTNTSTHHPVILKQKVEGRVSCRIRNVGKGVKAYYLSVLR